VRLVGVLAGVGKRDGRSGRGFRGRRKETCEGDADGGGSRFAKSLDDAGKSFKSPRPAFITGAMRYFTRDHRWTQFAFGPIVGRFDGILIQEPQQVAPILLSAHSVQQPLIVVVAQNPVPQMACEFLVERPGLLLVFSRVQFGFRGPGAQSTSAADPSGSG
jgi:hypothetical protein